MSDSNYTHIVTLLDASGSMLRLKSEVVKNLNVFISQQRTESLQMDGRVFALANNSSKIEVRCTVDVISFQGKVPVGGSTIEQLYAAKETQNNPDAAYHYKRIKTIADVNQGPVTILESDYIPYGGTPLMDAFDRAIGETESYICGLSKETRPARVIFVLVTDGEDHESQRITKAALNVRINNKIEHDNWQFLYVGADHNSFVEAKGYGFSGNHTMNFIATVAGISAAFAGITNTVLMKRCVSDPSLMKHCNFESHTKPKSSVELQAEAAVQAGMKSQAGAPLVSMHGNSSTTEKERLEVELFNQATRADRHTGHSPNTSQGTAQSGSSGYTVYDYRSRQSTGNAASSSGSASSASSCSTPWYSKPKRKADKQYFTEEVNIQPDPDEQETQAKHTEHANAS